MKNLAAEIAIQTIQAFESNVIEEVVFCCFDDENFGIYEGILRD